VVNQWRKETRGLVKAVGSLMNNLQRKNVYIVAHEITKQKPKCENLNAPLAFIHYFVSAKEKHRAN
jgi:hypothetical protein